uniref:Uncharacterized protein Mb2253c family n=1 Tax=Cajanus cajan TaxID=3821 RepID=A0A151QX13_CAJCA|nr:Uncharacterized protein Mb2253c family [Cajanus cajan]
MLELAIKFDFKATNNQAEYEALLASLTLAKDVGVKRLKCCSDSKLITKQVEGGYQTKEPQLQRYNLMVSRLTSFFDVFQMEHIPRAHNVRADLLSKHASTKRPGQHKTIIQETIATPSCQVTAIYELFKRGFSMPLLKCLDTDQANYVMDEIHRGICGMHSRARSMAVRVIRAGYYWPTITTRKIKIREGKNLQLRINHKVTSVEHPQTNGQVEVANKVILRELRKRLGSSKEEWVDELPGVLWAYHCTPQTTTQETLYKLTYGSDSMILVKVREPSHRQLTFDTTQNTEALRIDLDLIDEIRQCAQVQEEACKLISSRRYNSKLKPRSFREGDLVWRAVGEARKDTSVGKFVANWEGPFRISECLHNGAYRLIELDGKVIPRTWNATHLKFYYS